nr:outer dense fiber protein 3-B-like [Nomia melanderi]
MPPKPDSNESEPKPAKKTATAICGVRSPGPKYPLKTLVGYKEHCLSKYRNPAYSFGAQLISLRACEGPGPKYLLPDPKRGGFSFGLVGRSVDTFCGPGPKYVLPTPKTPAFSLKSRIKLRDGCTTPGPYYVKFPREGPAFSLAIRTPGVKCIATPAPYSYQDKTCSPKFSITGRPVDKEICRSPGPKYHVKPMKPTPAYSFGTKHSECAPPYILECDEIC